MTSKTVEKALGVLFAFSGAGSEIGLVDLAQRLGYDKSTLSRLLRSLEAYGLVVMNRRTHKYRLGPRILELAQNFHVQYDIGAAALPEMIQLREALGETVGLSIPIGTGRVCIEQVECQKEIRAVLHVGKLLPFHAGSIGRAMLAHMSQPEIDRILKQPLERFTEQTIVDPETLRENLKAVRTLGYAISTGERLSASCAVSVPILDEGRTLLGALTVIGPQGRLTPELAVQHVELLKPAAARIGGR